MGDGCEHAGGLTGRQTWHGTCCRTPVGEEPMSAPLFFMAPGAPTPVAPFSHAVEVDGWCFVTGQMPTFPEDEAPAIDLDGMAERRDRRRCEIGRAHV